MDLTVPANQCAAKGVLAGTSSPAPLLTASPKAIKSACRLAHLQGLAIGDRHFANSNQAWLYIDAVKQRLLGRHIGPDHPDFKQASSSATCTTQCPREGGRGMHTSSVVSSAYLIRWHELVSAATAAVQISAGAAGPTPEGTSQGGAPACQVHSAAGSGLSGHAGSSIASRTWAAGRACLQGALDAHPGFACPSC